MQPMSPAQVRASLRNVDDRARNAMQLPRDLSTLDWAGRDVLAWRDPRAHHRGYIVRWADNRPQGLLLRLGPASGRADRAVMCTLCRFTARFDEVALLSAPKPGPSGQRGDSIGLLACEDLACHARLRSTPAPGPFDPDPATIISRRIAGFQERIEGFFAAVLQ